MEILELFPEYSQARNLLVSKAVRKIRFKDSRTQERVRCCRCLPAEDESQSYLESLMPASCPANPTGVYAFCSHLALRATRCNF